jgi:hypothetical protein
LTPAHPVPCSPQDVALDLLIKLDGPSTPQHFVEELHGLADGSGASFETLLRIHFLGELTQVRKPRRNHARENKTVFIQVN